MNPCYPDFMQIDSFIDTLEDSLKLKAFYQVLRSTKPKPCKRRISALSASRNLCERKRPPDPEEIKRQNQARKQRELLLLQCMLASLQPLKAKLKEYKTNKESFDLKSQIIKHCLYAAIELVLESRRKAELQRKRNAYRALLNNRSHQLDYQTAQRPTMEDEVTTLFRQSRDRSNKCTPTSRKHHYPDFCLQGRSSKTEQVYPIPNNSDVDACDLPQQHDYTVICNPLNNMHSSPVFNHRVNSAKSGDYCNCLECRGSTPCESKSSRYQSKEKSKSDSKRCSSKLIDYTLSKKAKRSQARREESSTWCGSNKCSPSKLRECALRRKEYALRKRAERSHPCSPIRHLKDESPNCSKHSAKSSSPCGSNSSGCQSQEKLKCDSKKCPASKLKDESPNCSKHTAKSSTSFEPKSSRCNSKEKLKSDYSKSPHVKDESPKCSHHMSKECVCYGKPTTLREGNHFGSSKSRESVNAKLQNCKEGCRGIDSTKPLIHNCSNAQNQKSSKKGCFKRRTSSDTSNCVKTSKTDICKKRRKRQKKAESVERKMEKRNRKNSRYEADLKSNSKQKTNCGDSSDTDSSLGRQHSNWGCLKRCQNRKGIQRTNSKSSLKDSKNSRERSSEKNTPKSVKISKESPKRSSRDSISRRFCRDKKPEKNKPPCRCSRESSLDSKCTATSLSSPLNRHSGGNLKPCSCHIFHEETKQLQGGCDNPSASSLGTDKTTAMPPKASVSTDTMHLTRFRGRWFIRGNDTLVHQHFLPSRSSLKSLTHTKVVYEKKWLRFNSRSTETVGNPKVRRNFINSSDLSTNDNYRRKVFFHRQFGHSKSPSSNDRNSTTGINNRLPGNSSLHDGYKGVINELKGNRQKGGETTDTDTKSNCLRWGKKKRCCKKKKKDASFDVPSTTECSSLNCQCLNECEGDAKAAEKQCLCETKIAEVINQCACEPCEEMAAGVEVARGLYKLKTNNQKEVDKAQQEPNADFAKEESFFSLMSDISLTKVYRDLVTVIRPDLMSDDEANKPNKKQTGKKKKFLTCKHNNMKEASKQKPQKIMFCMVSSPKTQSRRSKQFRRPRRRTTQSCDCIERSYPQPKYFTSQKVILLGSDVTPCLNLDSFRNQSTFKSVCCGKRKACVNNLSPERWAHLKSKLKIPKNPVPLPQDFILDVKTSRTDVEIARCRKEKRKRQLEEWRKNIERKKLESDPLFCSQILISSVGEEPGSEAYYVCKPVEKRSIADGGGFIYECSYCPSPNPVGAKGDSKCVVKCEENMSASKRAPQRTSAASSAEKQNRLQQYQRTSPSPKRAMFPERHNTSPSTESNGKPNRGLNHNLPQQRRKTPSLKGAKSDSYSNSGKNTPKTKNENKADHFRNGSSNSSEHRNSLKNADKSKSVLQTNFKLLIETSPGRRYSPSPASKRNRSSSYRRSRSSSYRRSSAHNKSNKISKDNWLCRESQQNDSCQQSCNCEACVLTAAKIVLDRQRTRTLHPSCCQCGQEQTENTVDYQCSLCNISYCPFRTIEKDFACSHRNQTANKPSLATAKEQQEFCTRAIKSFVSKFGKQSQQENSCCCSEDFTEDVTNYCDKAEPSCSCNPDTQLDLLEDNCFKRTECVNSLERNKTCLYLWMPPGPSTDEKTESDDKHNHICTTDGNIVEVIRVQSNELGFLAQQNGRQCGGCIQTKKSCHNAKSKKKQRQRTSRSKSLKKQVCSYKIKCQSEESKRSKSKEISTNELLLTACQFKNKESTIPSAVKIKICKSMRPMETNLMSEKSTLKKALSSSRRG